jgi:hypothetical protein
MELRVRVRAANGSLFSSFVAGTPISDARDLNAIRLEKVLRRQSGCSVTHVVTVNDQRIITVESFKADEESLSLLAERLREAVGAKSGS